MTQPALWMLLAAMMPWAWGEKIPGRYIVELETEPVAAHVQRQAGRGRVRIDSEAARAQRERIRGEQGTMRGRIEGRGGRVLDGVETVANALFVEATEAEAARLAGEPGVKRVRQERTFRLAMDRAVQLQRVVEAWNRVGVERAGEGIKIGIIDSGIDVNHPAFGDTTMSAPEGFPKLNYSADAPNTNGKVIVARSYVGLLQYRDVDYSSRDHIGHGTAMGSITAGVKSDGPLATVMGVAPRAWLGNYKVFGTPMYNDSASDSAILKALDDAVADGMDVINMSLGDDFAPRLKDDLDVEAVERAVQAGVIVVVAAGNNGPGMNTISSPATAPSAIAVGATSSDRTFGTSVEAAGVGTFLAYLGSGPVPAAPVSAPLADVEALDGNGLACVSLPGGSLSGRVALILRGSCTFETKLINAQRAGAVAAVVYATSESPNAFLMSVGTAALAAQMVSHDDGMALKRSVGGGAEVPVTLRFTLQAVGIAANQVTDFSAIGPGVEQSIKPDLMATGGDMYVATQRLNPNGEMYSAYGYTLADGTSFSAPLVAGAAALVKSARPGLAADEYRSLLVNTAARSVRQRTGEEAPVQESGAGLLDVEAALQGTVTAHPVSLSFGAGGRTLDLQRNLRLKNVSKETESYAITVKPRQGDAAPSLEKELVELAPGSTLDLGVKWAASGLGTGSYEGRLEVQGLQSGTVMRVPYWYAVTGEPAGITLLSVIDSARRGTTQQDAVYVRITDASGVALGETAPEVTVVSGGGAAGGVANYDAEIPGLFGITVRMGTLAGVNVFRIKAGTAVLDVAISGL